MTAGHRYLTIQSQESGFLMFHLQRSLLARREPTGCIVQRPTRRQQFWARVEYIFLALGLTLLAVFGALLFERVFSSHASLRKFALVQAGTPASFENGESANGSAETVSAFHREQQGPVQERSRSSQTNAPLAVLRIAKLRLAVPLLDGTDALTLNHAVGRIAGTAWPGESGNIGIAGHRDSFFRGLKDVKVGDAIELETPRETDTYIVDQIQIVTPDAVNVLLPRSSPSVTLVTCYPFYFIGSAPKRFIVTASLTQQIESDRHRF